MIFTGNIGYEVDEYPFSQHYGSNHTVTSNIFWSGRGGFIV